MSSSCWCASSRKRMIRLTERKWLLLYARLGEEYQHEPSVLLIRGKMRRVLGFTDRRHREWIEAASIRPGEDGKRGYIKEWVCLDFYDDALETWFRLKYAEYL